MAAATTGKTNWFAVWVSAAVVVVLVVLGGFVWFLNSQATAPGAAPSASTVFDPDEGSISFGTGDKEIDVFVDFICPICGNFEDTFGEGLQAAAANNEITLNVHPISILDRYSTSEYSSRAASAMLCVASESPDAALSYFNLLFENQPEEGSAGLDDDTLASLAEQAGASDAATSCIADETYATYAQDQATNHDISGTPTVEIDGTRIDNEDLSTELAAYAS